jgi:hypothetical protein
VTSKYDAMTVDELDAETVKVKQEQPAKMKETLRAIRAVRDPKVAVARAQDRMVSILIAQGQTAADARKIVEEKGDKWSLDMVGQFEGLKVGTTVEPGTAVIEAKGR